MTHPTATLPDRLYTAEQARRLDRIAIEGHQIPGYALMDRAGLSAFHAMHARWPEARRIAVLCGAGNNGGDGYVLARYALQAGLSVKLLQMGNHQRLAGDARTAADHAMQAGVPCRPFDATALDDRDLLVDGLLGTGLDRPVEGAWRQAIERVNQSGLPVLALDIPSGLNADTGAVLGAAVRARVTVSFIAVKRGLLTGQGPDHCGCLLYSRLDVPDAVLNGQQPSATRVGRVTPLPRRSAGAHKGDHGHVLVVGGEQGYFGAAVLAAEAAARCGAGLVSVATRAAHGAFATSPRPEPMIHGVEKRAQLDRLLARATVVVLGPGLGQGEWGARMYAAVMESRLPLVQDADALNLLALDPEPRAERVITPHPGEAARLLGCRSAEIQGNRFSAAEELQLRYGGVVVLKGAGTIVHSADAVPAVCSLGNPGLAGGGTGDVLSGVIAALIAQGQALRPSAEQGVALHGLAGDRAAAAGQRGLLARDLMPHLRALVNTAC